MLLLNLLVDYLAALEGFFASSKILDSLHSDIISHNFHVPRRQAAASLGSFPSSSARSIGKYNQPSLTIGYVRKDFVPEALSAMILP